MNYRGKFKFSQLNPCRVCNMDAGERMMTETLPEKFFVVCRVCGFKTRAHASQSAATREWNGGNDARN